MNIDTGSALLKAICVAAVAVLMMIPLAMLKGLIFERTESRARAVDAVARGWGGRQSVGGPVIAIPVSIPAEADKVLTREWYVLPDSLEIQAGVDVAASGRKVGMYEVPVYAARIQGRARFDIDRQLARLAARDSSAALHPERARLLIPIGDPGGVQGLKVTSGQYTDELEPARAFETPVMMRALPIAPGAGPLEVGVDLQIGGTESLAFLPLARATRVSVKGNWPHPGFTRGFLPMTRAVTRSGFEATWQVLDLKRSFGSFWLDGQITREELDKSAFGVDLVQPVDLYQQITRSVKYGGLFVSLSLLTLFLFERIVGRPLHPIQYGLLALALGVFYLLLLALAEHIGFACAYLAAATALCALLGVYLAGVLRSRAAGGASGGIYAVVYGLLYLLVTSEDYSLLAGSIALFALLATLMVLTRKVDWYGNDAQSG